MRARDEILKDLGISQTQCTRTWTRDETALIREAESRLIKDVPNLLDTLAAKDAEIERLHRVATCAGVFLTAVGDYNKALPDEESLALAMIYANEACDLSDALEEAAL